ncbi:LapA family protein [Citromicrobium sp. JL477]|uniref:LapA family protein n=1 Tax=Citromicrobium sp. JL477 TaxID=1634516 RepID=UPI00031416F3|nr:LapA family protein [Citromicrobium sp. JL477]
MQIVRMILWVILLVAVIIFSWSNWNPVEVTIWDNLVVETKVPALVIISFLIGFLPVWLYSRGVIWSLNRKIRSLEIAAKASSVSAAARESDREEAERQEEAHSEPQPAPATEPAPAAVDTTPTVDETPAEEETRLTADDTAAGDAPAADDRKPTQDTTASS